MGYRLRRPLVGVSVIVMREVLLANKGKAILLYAAGWLLAFSMLMIGAFNESVLLMASAIVFAIANLAVLEWRKHDS